MSSATHSYVIVILFLAVHLANAFNLWRPTTQNTGSNAMFGQLCRVVSADDFEDGEILLDLGCPSNEELIQRDVDWENTDATAFFIRGVPSTTESNICKITTSDGRQELLDLDCPYDCDMTKSRDITWEGQAASAYACSARFQDGRQSDSWDDVSQEDVSPEDLSSPEDVSLEDVSREDVSREDVSREDASEESTFSRWMSVIRSYIHLPDPQQSQITRERSKDADFLAVRRAPKPCKIVGIDGSVYLDMKCPDACRLEGRTATWEDNSATAYYCARPNSTKDVRR